jgi:hypothetical protein
MGDKGENIHRRLSESVIARAADRMIDKRLVIGDRFTKCPGCGKQIEISMAGMQCPKCQTPIARGWDCLNSLRDFYRDCGFPFPEEYKGWNWVNYAEKWMDDPEEGRIVFMELLRSLGREVGRNYAIRGDLLIIKSQPPKMTLGRATLDILKAIVENYPFMRKIVNRTLEGRQLLSFPAIYLGNGHILLVCEKGVKTFPLKFFRSADIEVRRLL